MLIEQIRADQTRHHQHLWFGCDFVGADPSGAFPAQAYPRLGPNTKSDFRLWTSVYLTVKAPASFHRRGYEYRSIVAPPGWGINEQDLSPSGTVMLASAPCNQTDTLPLSPFFEENRIYQQANDKQTFSTSIASAISVERTVDPVH